MAAEVRRHLKTMQLSKVDTKLCSHAYDYELLGQGAGCFEAG